MSKKSNNKDETNSEMGAVDLFSVASEPQSIKSQNSEKR